MAKLIRWFVAAFVSTLASTTVAASEVSWIVTPPGLTRIQGQSMTLTWNFNTSVPLGSVKVWRDNQDVIFHNIKTGYIGAKGEYVNRSADLNITTSNDSSLWNVTFFMKNLAKNKDEGEYIITANLEDGGHYKSPITPLTINVATTIISSHPYTIAANENQIVKLVCNATGFPTPTVNWTRNGVVVGTGNPFNITAKPEDHNQCYTCVAFNGVYDAKTANVCLTVQYQFKWTTTPPSLLERLYGESMRLFWVVDVSPTTFQSATVWRTKDGSRTLLYSQYANGSIVIIDEALQNRSSDVAIRAFHSGPIVNITFELLYVIKSSDEAFYDVSVTGLSGNTDVVPSKAHLAINESVLWTKIPSSVSKLYGESALLNWIVRVASRKVISVVVSRTKDNTKTQVITYSAANNITTVQGNYTNRSSDIILEVTKQGSIINIGFRMLHLVKSTDEAQYDVSVTFESNTTNTVPSKTQVTIDDTIVWSTIPAALTRIQGQNMTLNWVINVAYHSFKAVKVWRIIHGNKEDVVFYHADTGIVDTKGLYENRTHHVNLTASQLKSVVAVKFSLTNIDKNADEGEYDLTLTLDGDIQDAPKKTQLIVNVPPTISSSHKYIIAANETQTVNLVCSITGYPTPTVNWTRNGVVIGTGNPFNITAIPEDHNQCYTCIAFNGVYDAKTANVCLTVQYKPRSASLTVDRPTVCQNDTVNMTCISGPSNPAPYSYKFYYNNVLVQNSNSNVYATNATNDSPEVNRFTCVPSNLLGDALKNATTDVTAKVPPSVTQKSNDKIVLEGSNLTLTCNVSGELPLNVTWTKNGQYLFQGNAYSINSIKRGHEGVYRCKVTNGIECPSSSATINVNVKYSPIILNGNSIVSANLGESARLTCNAIGFPLPNINWTRNGLVVYTGNPYITTPVSKSNESTCYTCIAINELGVKSANICLTVHYKPEATRFTISPFQNRFCKTNVTTFTCNSTAKPPAEYSLYRADRSGNKQLVQGRSNDGIFVVQLNETGNITFTCVPNNTVGEGKTMDMLLLVKDPPSIVVSPRDVALVEGQRLTLFCNASGHPAPNVTWSKVGGNTVGHGNTFTISNISREDEGSYRCVVNNGDECDTDSAIANVTVNYSPNITTPHPQTVTVREGEQASLICEATGKPTPNINWTRDGVIVHTGSPYNTRVLTHNDNKACYTCIAYNGVVETKTANFCLNVQYKPRSASLTVDRSTVCQNDTVNMTCTSGPSNPAPSSYKFYYNNVLVQNSPSNIYTTTATNGSPEVNRFSCVPTNLLGDALKNATTDVTAKVAPGIAYNDWNEVAIEGSNLFLKCNVSGTPTPIVNWTNATGHHLFQGDVYSITNITRGDEGVYRCTVTNGDECPTKTATINVTVNYKPEATRFTISPSQIRFCKTNTTTFTCKATAKPPAEYSLLRNSQLVQGTSKNGTFVVNLNEKGENTFTCVPKNTAGEGERKSIQLFLTDPPKIDVSLRDVVLEEGQRLTLFCNASGHPAPNVTWFKVGGNTVGHGNTFTINNISRGHEGSYRCLVNNGEECDTDSAIAKVTVNVPIKITTSHPKDITVNEDKRTSLVCEAAGKPTPHINWTRDGAIVHTGSPYNTPALTHNDNKACYTCIAYNGVVETKTAKFCLNVQYKPRNASLTVDRSTVCQNDTVKLTCTSGPANPAPSSYKFYYNNVLVQNSNSNVYITKANHGSPDVNRFICIPSNLLGNSLTNATMEVIAKAPPVIVNTTKNPIVVEGSNLDISCEVSGTKPLTVNWTKNGEYLFQGDVNSINSIKRGDEGVYRCTVTNGDECPTKSATINVTVNYKPESTHFTSSLNQERFCKGNSTTFTCKSTSNPPAEYSLYRNNQLVQGRSNDGNFVVKLNKKGVNMFTCVPNNIVGEGENKTIQVFVTDPPSIAVSPQDVVLKEGERLTLFCSASGHPTPNVTWFKVGGNTVGHGNTLSISSVSRGAEGSYRCVVNNGQECDTDSAIAKVTVNFVATIVRSPPRDVTLYHNDRLNLICEAEGKPQPTITWRRSDRSEIIGRGSKLELSAVESLPGNYTCNASNGISSVNSFSHITVLACQNHKCQNGTCVALGTTYSCNCLQGYKGNLCESYVCQNHRCQHGGICITKSTGYGCQCTRGLKGTYCEQEDPLHTIFNVEIALSKPDWRPEYYDERSQQFKDLKNTLCKRMTVILINLINCKVIWFRPGSIISKIELTFNETKTESEVLNILKNRTAKNMLDGIELKPSSLQVKSYETPCSKEPCKFDGECHSKDGGFICKCTHFRYGKTCEKGIGLVAGVILIIAAILVLLFAIFLIMSYFREKRTTDDNIDGFDNGIRMKSVNYNNTDHSNARNNRAVYYEDYLEEGTLSEEKEIVNGHMNGNTLELGSAVLCYKI